MRTASTDPSRRSPETTSRSRRGASRRSGASRPSSQDSDDPDDPDDVTSVEIKLTARQIDWLRTQAQNYDASLSAVLRAVVNEQATRRAEPSATSPDAAEDSTPDASANRPASGDASDGATSASTGMSQTEGESLLDDLKDAQERLESLVNGDEDDQEDTSSRNIDLQSLVNRLNDRSAPEDTGQQVDDGPSPLEEGLAALEHGTDAGPDAEDDADEDVNSFFDVPDDE